MNKLKPNMYIRTKEGKIDKILEINTEDFDEPAVRLASYPIGMYQGMFEYKKASYNIIDLINPKDIILGTDGKLYQCWKVYKDYVFTYSKNKQGQTITLVDYQIDKILCYEQFESISYEVSK